MDLPLSLHFPHSLSISLSPSVPLHLPSPLPLCGVDSLPCQLHLLVCGSCHHIVIIIYCNPAHFRIMFSQITCNITCYLSYNVIKQCLSILLCSRLLSMVLLVNYNKLYMYIQTYILHVHCVYGVHTSKRLNLLL